MFPFSHVYPVSVKSPIRLKTGHSEQNTNSDAPHRIINVHVPGCTIFPSEITTMIFSHLILSLSKLILNMLCMWHKIRVTGVARAKGLKRSSFVKQAATTECSQLVTAQNAGYTDCQFIQC